MRDWGRLWLDQEASVHAVDRNMLLRVHGQSLNTWAIPTEDLARLFFLEDKALDHPKDYWLLRDDKKKPLLTENSLSRDTDFMVVSNKSTLAACFMNYKSYQTEVKRNNIVLKGAFVLETTSPSWMATSEIGRGSGVSRLSTDKKYD